MGWFLAYGQKFMLIAFQEGYVPDEFLTKSRIQCRFYTPIAAIKDTDLKSGNPSQLAENRRVMLYGVRNYCGKTKSLQPSSPRSRTEGGAPQTSKVARPKEGHESRR